MGGIKQHGTGIQITFSWNGKRHRPTLAIPYTPSNIKYAERLKGEIERSIALGNYTLEAYANHFPTSRIANSRLLNKPNIPTFRELSKTWLKTIENSPAATKNAYRTALNYWLTHIGDMPITDIKYSTLLALSNNSNRSAGTRNGYLIVLRAVFNIAYLDEIIDKNPTERIKNSTIQQEPPDPFTLLEVDLILDKMRKNQAQVANYFEFAFFSGCRPEEIITLKWSDIDFKINTARIKRVRSAGEDRETTKTSRIRDIEMNTRALAAIVAQKQFTFMKDEYVFHNPYTNKRWANPQQQNLKYWQPTIKALGLRYRVPYQCRHTFATMNLMAGANPMWVAKQMGHTTMKMLLSVYSRWIDGADSSKEKSKIEAIFDAPCHKYATGN